MRQVRLADLSCHAAIELDNLRLGKAGSLFDTWSLSFLMLATFPLNIKSFLDLPGLFLISTFGKALDPDRKYTRVGNLMKFLREWACDLQYHAMFWQYKNCLRDGCLAISKTTPWNLVVEISSE